jgi:uncharacterized protein YktA (UPF0223 family)
MLARYRKSDFDLRKREYSANFIKDWNHHDLVECQVHIHEISWDHIPPDDIHDKISNNHTSYLSVIRVLNFFEEMAQSIEYGLSDEEYLRKYFTTTSLDTFNRFKPFIQLQRSKLKTNQLFISFEKLVYRWERQYKNEELLPSLKTELK